jgi:hypothetical protein
VRAITPSKLTGLNSQSKTASTNIGRWTGTNAKTKRNVAKYLDKVPKDVAEDLAHYQPFSNCGWSEILRDISNRDKHRHLNTLTVTNKLIPEGEISRVIDPVANAQSLHMEGQLEVGVYLPTGEDVIDAAHLIQREARALVRSYAGRFKFPPPSFV